jgi:hypothetical protein
MNQHCYVRDDPHISLATSIEVDHDTRHTRFIYIQTSSETRKPIDLNSYHQGKL